MNGSTPVTIKDEPMSQSAGAAGDLNQQSPVTILQKLDSFAKHEYSQIRYDGPPHARKYTMQVTVRGKVFTGEGKTQF